MQDNKQRLWGVFTKTGKIEDYLNYKAVIKDNAFFNRQADNESDFYFTDDEDREQWL